MYLWRESSSIFPIWCTNVLFTKVIIFSSIYFKWPESGPNILSTFTWWKHDFWEDCTFPWVSIGMLKILMHRWSLCHCRWVWQIYKGWHEITAPSFLMCDSWNLTLHNRFIRLNVALTVVKIETALLYLLFAYGYSQAVTKYNILIGK